MCRNLTLRSTTNPRKTAFISTRMNPYFYLGISIVNHACLIMMFIHDSLWTSDAIWWHRSGQTSVRNGYLTNGTSPLLNQYSQKVLMNLIRKMCSEISLFGLLIHLPAINEFNYHKDVIISLITNRLGHNGGSGSLSLACLFSYGFINHISSVYSVSAEIRHNTRCLWNTPYITIYHKMV